MSKKLDVEGKPLTGLGILKLFCIFIVEILLGCLSISLTAWKIIRYDNQPVFRFMMSRALEFVAVICLLCSGILRHQGIRRFLFGPPQAVLFLFALILNVVVLTLLSTELVWILATLVKMVLCHENVVQEETVWMYGIIPFVLDFLMICTTYRVLPANVRFYTTIEIEKALKRADGAEQECGEKTVAENHNIPLILVRSPPLANDSTKTVEATGSDDYEC
ncbi:uncharacterized protein LOC129601253 [Paramacrobiotus metropolitanus]|uniref:uncharacterized protein LOC129601253 n=1 Tax=Paramacrobiotus metropolitanus TaxID=2943436 RepID=UPI0024462BD4|nr:uncharacterized protein LOC129601253 [Paramacrobiotus metropolitanus]